MRISINVVIIDYSSMTLVTTQVNYRLFYDLSFEECVLDLCVHAS